MAIDIFKGASEQLIKNMFLEDGTLYVHSIWRGEPELISFVGLAKKRGIVSLKFLDTTEFEKRSAAAKVAGGEWQHSELQAYAVQLLQTAFEQKASDIHICDYGNYGVIQFRCLGMLREHTYLPGEKTKQLISVIYGTLSQQGTTATHTPSVRQDARIAKREYLPRDVHSIRVHTEPLESAQAEGGAGCMMCLRLLYDRTLAGGTLFNRLEVLGYSKQDQKQFEVLTHRAGLTVISGPTGHGKSTLLKHVMESQADERAGKNYLSIEDPPEYPLAGVKQIMVNTGASPADAEKRNREYEDAIAGAMRCDPDVIMVGEIRYPEAAVAAIEAASSGHSVWATLHAGSALGIVTRLKTLLSGVYEEPLEYICDPKLISGLIYQRLVPTLCPECKMRLLDVSKEYRQTVMPDDLLERVKESVRDVDNVHIRGNGCPRCAELGFVDQTVAAEVVVADGTLLRYIRAGQVEEAHEYWRRNLGGKTCVEDAIDKIEAGLLDPALTEERIDTILSREGRK
jgi:type II secretory ATPase GspE/PulE/Tfp pilus assembly ATPase PilB-like protein